MTVAVQASSAAGDEVATRPKVLRGIGARLRSGTDIRPWSGSSSHVINASVADARTAVLTTTALWHCHSHPGHHADSARPSGCQDAALKEGVQTVGRPIINLAMQKKRRSWIRASILSTRMRAISAVGTVIWFVAIGAPRLNSMSHKHALDQNAMAIVRQVARVRPREIELRMSLGLAVRPPIKRDAYRDFGHLQHGRLDIVGKASERLLKNMARRFSAKATLIAYGSGPRTRMPIWRTCALAIPHSGGDKNAKSGSRKTSRS